MELAVQYSRKRCEFGRYCALDDAPARILDSVTPAAGEGGGGGGGGGGGTVRRRPVQTTLDCAPVQSEHEANTDCVLRRSAGVLHRAGGWPDNVDAAEPEQVRRAAGRPARARARGLARPRLGPAE